MNKKEKIDAFVGRATKQYGLANYPELNYLENWARFHLENIYELYPPEKQGKAINELEELIQTRVEAREVLKKADELSRKFASLTKF